MNGGGHVDKTFGKPCNGIELPELNYEAMKRELLPMLNSKEYHQAKAEDFTRPKPTMSYDEVEDRM